MSETTSGPRGARGREPSRAPRRGLALLIALAPAVAWCVTSLAAAPPKVENPHGAFREPCALCHTAKGWKEVRVGESFDHARYGFALTGAHRADCLACHATIRFEAPDFRCASCHEDPHRGEMGPDCARCHTARSFVDRAPMIRAHQLTRFPLTGTHASLECESCHALAAQGHLRFAGTRAACEDCHLADYQAARTPDHRAGGFPLQCAQCHSTLTWNTAKVDHDRTAFPLTGAHRLTPCASCHGDGVYGGKPTDCAACHRGAYDATTDPGHVAAAFPLQCASCHTTTAWRPAAFDHAGTSFPLTGAHRAAACASCHGGGLYAGTPSDCAACHRGDYDAATNPDHAAAAFPLECASCHSTTAWQPSTFDHDGRWFPIYSGVHAGRWSQCAECHTVPANFTAFTCLTCHPHSDRGKTDDDHSGETGYVYDSAACYTCHPQGRH